MLLIPAALLALILMSFNFLGDALRDFFDARQSR
jgi:ABC-type dipeptide/oligopeptide/nickel transport system permease subunit